MIKYPSDEDAQAPRLADARDFTAASLRDLATEAAALNLYTVVHHANHVSTHELIAVTSLGKGWLAFKMEPLNS